MSKDIASRSQPVSDDASRRSGEAEPSAAGEIPTGLAELIVHLGEAEWGATAPKTAVEHGAHVARSVDITAKTFSQTGRQPMNGLYLAGTETVLCHTGTSPNSGAVARALTAAWNRLVAESRAQLALARAEGRQ